MNLLFRKIHEHLILPFEQSEAPVAHIARGAAIGVFIGLTPTVGVQMYIVATLWILFRYVFRFHFNLPIAVATVWVSNPVTVIPFLWIYLLAGDWLLGLLGWAAEPREFAAFKELLAGDGSGARMALGARIKDGFLLGLWLYGWPILAGSMIFAVPLSVGAYLASTVAVLRYRAFRAAQEGISYGEWRERHIKAQ
ncbi:MAG: DUF2062 domain-containing protein [bacterium]